MSTSFADASAVHPDAAGHWTAEIDAGWFAPTGPNGGYLAAIVLRALTAAVGDPARHPRTLTLHYLRGPQPGPVEIVATVEKVGRSLTTLSARLEQDGRLCVLALGAFSIALEESLAYADPPPEVPPPEQVERTARSERAPEIFHRLEVRPCLGYAPFEGAPEAVTGGWLGFDVPQIPDAPACACLTDAWWPAPWARTTGPVIAPTVEMTFHFRARLPVVAAPGLVLGRFTSNHAADGFAEESASLWSPDGTLLAEARQLALIRALP